MGSSVQPQRAGAPWLDPVGLWTEARRKTAVEESVAEPSWPALEALCGSLNAIGSRLHFFGKQRIRQRLVESLAWRVRLAQAFAEHPEIKTTPLPRPVVIVGPFRSGTTYLHRLLSEDSRFRWVRSWEVMYAPHSIPTRAGPEIYIRNDERIDRLQRDLRKLYRRQPELARLHPVAPNEAEECFGFLEASMLSPSFLFYAPVFGYLAWLDQHADESVWDAAYAQYQDHLRLLAWLFPGQRWLLKSPVHLWNLGAFRRVFPDALFVHTHRNPAEVVLSLCHLIRAHHELSLHATDALEIGQLAWRFYEYALPRAVSARRAAAAGSDIDLAFSTVVNDAMVAIRTVYAAAGLDMDGETETRIQRRIADHGTSTARTDVRGLEAFGLQQEKVRALFSEYQAFGI